MVELHKYGPRLGEISKCLKVPRFLFIQLYNYGNFQPSHHSYPTPPAHACSALCMHPGGPTTLHLKKTSKTSTVKTMSKILTPKLLHLKCCISTTEHLHLKLPHLNLDIRYSSVFTHCYNKHSSLISEVTQVDVS